MTAAVASDLLLDQFYKLVQDRISCEEENALGEQLGVISSSRDQACKEGYYEFKPYHKRREEARERILYSDAGLRTWREIVEREGWRDDDLALKVCRLAITFPTLDKKILDGILNIGRGVARCSRGRSMLELERFSCSAAATSGSRHAARFVLGVWNSSAVFACGQFDLHKAMATWDDGHRKAFLAWAKDPWWA